MKYSDDYSAKIEIWARESKVYPMPRLVGIPRFRARKFDSYEELNAWKRELLEQLASGDGVKWTK